MKNKQILEARLAKQEAKKRSLAAKGDSSQDLAEVRSINSQVAELNEEIEETRSMITAIEAEEEEARAAAAANGDPLVTEGSAATDGQPEQRDVMATYGTGSQAGQVTGEIRKATIDLYAQRGADLKANKEVTISINETPEERAVNIAGGTLVVPTKYSNTLSETFLEVSSLIDMVEAVPLNGGNAYVKGFEVSFGEGGETSEAADYNEDDPVMGYVDIGKSKITIYTEITDEASKLPNVDYQALVAKNIRVAIRKKIARQIVVGAGGTNQITGIFNAPVNVMPTADITIEISAIDGDTLDEIVFGYGGDEAVEGDAVLILSKADLKAFAQVKDNDGKKLYKIKFDKGANTGTISSEDSYDVAWVINSICPVLSAAGTAVDTKCMAYGKMMAYHMPIFSPLEVQMSKDFKFKSGQICFRGSVWVGGNVASYKGFSVITKVAAV